MFGVGLVLGLVEEGEVLLLVAQLLVGLLELVALVLVLLVELADGLLLVLGGLVEMFDPLGEGLVIFLDAAEGILELMVKVLDFFLFEKPHVTQGRRLFI